MGSTQGRTPDVKYIDLQNVTVAKFLNTNFVPRKRHDTIQRIQGPLTVITNIFVTEFAKFNENIRKNTNDCCLTITVDHGSTSIHLPERFALSFTLSKDVIFLDIWYFFAESSLLNEVLFCS